MQPGALSAILLLEYRSAKKHVTNLFAQEGNKFQLAACKTTAESDQLRSTYSQGFAMDENDAKHRFESASTRDEANHEHENIELHWSGEW